MTGSPVPIIPFGGQIPTFKDRYTLPTKPLKKPRKKNVGINRENK